MFGTYTGELAALATAMLWTTSSLVWTATGKRIGALAVSFIRIVMVCGLLLAYEQVTCGRCLPLDQSGRTWLLIGGSGFFWFFVSDLCLFKAFLLIGPRLALLILALSPPVAATLSWICIGDPLDLWRWMAMAVTLAGVAWVVSEQPNGQQHAHTRQERTRGVLLALLAAGAQAVAIVLSKLGIGNCEAMAATTISMLGALAGFATLVTIRGRWSFMLSATAKGQVMAILIIGVILGPLLGVVTQMIAIRHASAGVVATIIATMPVLILPLSIFVHRERPSLRAVIGAVFAVVGVGLLMWPG